jgi:SAM-dependent methyltransferase
MSKCLLCGGKVEFRFSARDYARPTDRTERSLNWCARCEFGRLEGEFSASEVSSFYPEDYYTHSIATNVPEGVPSFLERLRTHLAWRLDQGRDFHQNEIEIRGGTVCDIGCGAGQRLRLYKNAGFQTFGVEPDSIARSFSADAGEVFDGTAENPPKAIANRQFDVVQMFHVLEHCIDPAAAISNAKQMLAKDGTLIIEVPNNAALGFSTFKAAWPWTDIPRHLNFFTDKSLLTLLQRNRLKICKTLYAGYTRQFQPSWIAKEVEISRHILSGRAPNFDVAAWTLLLRTALSKDRYKYDSIRIHARHKVQVLDCPSSV